MAKQPTHQQKDFFVYVLGSRRRDDRRTYVGWTTDLERRLRQHNSGSGAKSTRGRQWLMLYSENCTTRTQAMSLEWHIKRDRKFRAALRVAIEPDQAARIPERGREQREHQR
ncbi:MAG TPA: GIY-YIG nuclease family protein [Xanthobacteraceae bacterium]|nr:GIY-YIG nuclease family protein [Xanthobacteraceae bacterium]